MYPHDTTKRCTKCDETKPLSEFIKGPRYADGYQPWCTDCRREYRIALRTDPAYVANERQRGREYYAQNRESIAPKRRAYDIQRWHNDPEVRRRKNAQKQAAIKRDPTKRAHERMRNRLRAHHRRTVTGTGNVTAAQWRKLCRQFNHCCAACGKKTRLTIDHIVPLSKGGKHLIENIQPLCMMCNQVKNTKTIDYRPIVQLSMDIDI